MTADSFAQLVILYGWFLLVALIAFLMLIARFYQRFSGEPTYYRLFLIPIALFGVQAVRQTNLAYDPAGDALAAIGGLTLMTLSFLLYRRMTAGRRDIRGQR